MPRSKMRRQDMSSPSFLSRRRIYISQANTLVT